jgi:hypothetical protein
MRTYLRSRHRPEAIVWINSSDLIAARGRLYVRVRHPDRRWADAQCRYELAVDRKLGIALEQVCEAPGLSCCRVYVPKNASEAGERLNGAGLTFTGPEKAPRAIPVTNRLYWAWLRLRGREQML